jgi:hypothetical protein
MDRRGEALIGLVGAHGDAFEFLEPAEEALDRAPPLALLSNAVSIITRSKANPSMSCSMSTVSKCCPGSSTKRTRLRSASVSTRILMVMPPFERPMARL